MTPHYVTLFSRIAMDLNQHSHDIKKRKFFFWISHDKFMQYFKLIQIIIIIMPYYHSHNTPSSSSPNAVWRIKNMKPIIILTFLPDTRPIRNCYFYFAKGRFCLAMWQFLCVTRIVSRRGWCLNRRHVHRPKIHVNAIVVSFWLQICRLSALFLFSDSILILQFIRSSDSICLRSSDEGIDLRRRTFLFLGHALQYDDGKMSNWKLE